MKFTAGEIASFSTTVLPLCSILPSSQPSIIFVCGADAGNNALTTQPDLSKLINTGAYTIDPSLYVSGKAAVRRPSQEESNGKIYMVDNRGDSIYSIILAFARLTAVQRPDRDDGLWP